MKKSLKKYFRDLKPNYYDVLGHTRKTIIYFYNVFQTNLKKSYPDAVVEFEKFFEKSLREGLH